MAAKIFRINYKSDFILTLNSDAGWMTPFCIKFWTGAPSQAYFAGYDGTTYTHCAPVEGEPTKLLVQFDDHHLPIGDLKFQIGYHFTVADFPTSVEDEVINQADVIIEQDGEPAQVMLDFNGETAPEIEFSLPAYANEAQRIANEQERIAAEEQRVSNEQQRISNEEDRISAEESRQEHEQQRIRNEETRIEEFAGLKADAIAATGAANDSATLANEKAALAQQKADYAQAKGDYAKAQGDTALADHERAESDHATAASDHTQASSDHDRAESDHSQAAQDHDRAESDHTRAESDHAAVEVYVDSLGAFDISSYHATGDVLAKYADLTAALGTNGANIPDALRKGGMSVKFVQSSDNKYVQYRLMHPLDNASTAAADFANTANWQGVDDEPTAGNENLVKSGGVAKNIYNCIGDVFVINSFWGNRITNYNNGQIGKAEIVNGVKLDGICVPVVEGTVYMFSDIQLWTHPNAVNKVWFYSQYPTTGNCLDCKVAIVAGVDGKFTVPVGAKYMVMSCEVENCGNNKRIVADVQSQHDIQVKNWILGECYTVSNIVRDSNELVNSADIIYPDGIAGTLVLTRNSDGDVTSAAYTYSNESYTLTVTRNSNGDVTSTSIIKN